MNVATWRRSALRAAQAISIVVLAASASSCDWLFPSSGCTRGMTVSCACPGGESGVQTCGDDGAYGSCECSGGGWASAATCTSAGRAFADCCDLTGGSCLFASQY